MQQIRNREAANIQITAEQLIKDARTQFGDVSKVQAAGSSYFSKDEFRIQDKEELAQFLQRKRKEYEDRIRKHRRLLRAYLDYARFEAAQEDYRRCRSILERAITVLSTEPGLWIAYSEIEAKGGFQNHALNVLHRAVGLLPRVDALWFKYVLFQESLGTEEQTREVFERWMSWEPAADEPWFAYASFEERHDQQGRARDVYERYCGTHPTAKAYIKYAKWEDSHNRVGNARNVYERAVGAAVDSSSLIPDQPLPAELPKEELEKPDLWLAFANFEARRDEPERARAVYQFALEKVQTESRGRIFASFASFEKKLKDISGRVGNEESNDAFGADAIVILRRREEYEQAVKANPRDFDAWFDLIRLEEEEARGATTSVTAYEKIRETYSRAQANPPLEQEKRFWRRYVYLFIYESLFEELTAKDVNRARQALKRGLDIVPHKQFTFAKLWILAAQLEIREKQLDAARKLLGKAIGMCPKDKLFRSYIQMELQLGEVDRCRKLYEKYLIWNPTNSQAWAKYCEMEQVCGEVKRTRTLYELGISQPVLDEPEKLWLRYIDFELTCEDEDEEDEEEPRSKKVKSKKLSGPERARTLYERLIERTEGKQSKIWVAYAKFLCFSTDTFTVKDARELLERAESHLKKVNLPDGRAIICQARVEMEQKVLQEEAEETPQEGAATTTTASARDRTYLEKALERVPKKVEKRLENGEVALEWLFPQDVLEEAQRAANDEEMKKKTALLKLLEEAQLKKKQKLQQQQ